MTVIGEIKELNRKFAKLTPNTKKESLLGQILRKQANSRFPKRLLNNNNNGNNNKQNINNKLRL
jgi:hypothetical protein